MATETLTYTYTSDDEIARLASQEGVNLRISDLTATNLSSYWEELIADATDIINQYCLGKYEDEDLADNRWVRIRASWIGLVQLCRRKMNPVPDAILQRYEEIIAELKAVLAGQLLIPRLATRSEMNPSMSNLRVDDSYRSRKLRVNPNISVGAAGSNQDVDYWFLFDWF